MSDTGVQDTLTILSANGGRRQIVTHRLASTDGAAHDVDARMTADTNVPSTGNQQFRMEWLPGGLPNRLPGQAFSPPPAAGTVLFRQNKTVAGGSVEFPIGALTMSPAPLFIKFDNGTPATELIMPYRATVSPGHDLVVKQQFDTEPSLALAQADEPPRAPPSTQPGRTGQTNPLPAPAVSSLAFSNSTFRAESRGPSARSARKKSYRAVQGQFQAQRGSDRPVYGHPPGQGAQGQARQEDPLREADEEEPQAQALHPRRHPEGELYTERNRREEQLPLHRSLEGPEAEARPLPPRCYGDSRRGQGQAKSKSFRIVR